MFFLFSLGLDPPLLVRPPFKLAATDLHPRGVRLPPQWQGGQQQMHPLPRVVLAEPARFTQRKFLQGST